MRANKVSGQRKRAVSAQESIVKKKMAIKCRSKQLLLFALFLRISRFRCFHAFRMHNVFLRFVISWTSVKIINFMISLRLNEFKIICQLFGHNFPFRVLSPFCMVAVQVAAALLYCRQDLGCFPCSSFQHKLHDSAERLLWVWITHGRWCDVRIVIQVYTKR